MIRIERKETLILILLLLLFWAGKNKSNIALLPPTLQSEGKWADSVLSTLSLEEKIAQMIMVAAWSNKDEKHAIEIDSLVEKYKIGGLIFFQGGPVRQAVLTNRYQSKSKVPLAIAIDGEWGLAMRLDSTLKYPWQMTLGAIQDNDLIYQMGKDIAEQCKRLGIHINFAPVVDVNVNPNNPIIYARSFGENKYNVSNKGIAYMKGLQAGGVLANAKHFPGHGDTDTDSHKTLPILKHNRSRIDSVEMYPFTQLIKEGLGSIMVAHLFIPSIEKTENTATTLSHNLVTKILKDSLGFKGLVFTDALNMKGVSKYNKPGEVDLKAFMAGNDVMLYCENVPKTIKSIKEAVDSGLVSESEINTRCRKILFAKEWMGLNHYQPIKTESLTDELMKPIYNYRIQELFEKSLTVLKNTDEIIPFKNIEKINITCLSIGSDSVSEFQKTLALYGNIKNINIPSLNDSNYLKIKEELANASTLVLAFHRAEANPIKRNPLNTKEKELLEKIIGSNRTILVWFANPYLALNLTSIDKSEAIVIAYQNTPESQRASAQLLYGAIGAEGTLPISLSKKYKEGFGININSIHRLRYTYPEAVGIESTHLSQIDSIALEGIREKAYPGCQVLVAKNGAVIYHKAFGTHTYDSTSKKVELFDVYDIASVTKITATLPSVMKLQDEKKFSLNDHLGHYLGKHIKNKEYKEINMREMLAHQAGLPAWVPFYTRTLINGKLDPNIYSKDSSHHYSVKVADSIYIKNYYPDTMLKRLYNIPLKKKEYRYSDIGYYFLKEIVEHETHQLLQDYTQTHFYKPLGMNRTTYLPLQKIPKKDIIPTEKDHYFRNQLIHGYVHDPGAAMLGGVGGHAGLFSNANDLAKIMQMYLYGGMYANEHYISSTTLSEYIDCQFCIDDKKNDKPEIRRGAGFDKPTRDGSNGPTCNCVSYLSFGHTGFTGTMAWADPEKQVVYIFLSNRVYPDGENKKLLNLNIRTRIQEEIYKAIEKSESK
ncbi:MAG: serine hydrolase [Flavobacteriales bacterium]|nr:serine hydrolase [Flavobacteriales bacterium]